MDTVGASTSEEALRGALESPNPSVRMRAHDALIARRLDAQRLLLKGPRKTVRLNGRLSEVVRALGRTFKACLAVDAGLADRQVGVSIERGTYLEAVDALCRSYGACDWRWSPGGVTQLISADVARAPAAYVGPLRIRAVSAAVDRSTDFRRRDSCASARLAVDFDPRLWLLGAAHLLMERGGGFRLVPLELPVGPPTGTAGVWELILRPLASTVRRLRPPRVKLRCDLPVSHELARFDRIVLGAEREVGSHFITITALHRDGPTLSFRLGTGKRVEPEDVARRVVLGTILGRDESGKEELGSVSLREVQATSNEPLTSIRVKFPSVDGTRLAHLRLRYLAQVGEHGVNMRLPEIPLP